MRRPAAAFPSGTPTPKPVGARAPATRPPGPPRRRRSPSRRMNGAGSWSTPRPTCASRSRRTPCLQPRGGLRSSPDRGVVLTNGDVDAIAGLLHLREGTPSRSTRTAGARRPGRPIRSSRCSTEDCVAPPGGAAGESRCEPRRCRRQRQRARGRLFAVPGKVPLYLESEATAPDTGGKPGDTLWRRRSRRRRAPAGLSRQLRRR